MTGEKLNTREAWAEAEETRSWLCQTCDVMTEGEGPHCRTCAAYWEDVRNGLWETEAYDNGE